MADNVNHPAHYESSCSIECIDSMLIAFGRAAVIHFCECNAYKYIWRYKNKNGMEDLEKAKWYVEKAFTLVDDYTPPEGELETLFNLKEIVTKLIAKEKKNDQS